MKYYIYISNAKVDMLLPQVPHDVKKKVSLELGFDFKVLKGTRKSETESDESRITRLETVVAFVNEYGKVGTVDEPDDFIYDTQPMWSGPFIDIAYFTGRTAKTIFGLAGSASHLIGAEANKQQWPAYSSLGQIQYWLESVTPSEDETRSIGAHVGSLYYLTERAREPRFSARRLEFWRSAYSLSLILIFGNSSRELM